MLPAILDMMTIVQHGTFRKRLVWSAGTPAVPVDLTGCTARAQIRPDYNSNVLLIGEMNTTNGGIVLGGVTGAIDLYIADEDTGAIAVGPYRRDVVVSPGSFPMWDYGVLDLLIEHPSGETSPLARGPVRVLAGGPRP